MHHLCISNVTMQSPQQPLHELYAAFQRCSKRELYEWIAEHSSYVSGIKGRLMELMDNGRHGQVVNELIHKLSKPPYLPPDHIASIISNVKSWTTDYKIETK